MNSVNHLDRYQYLWDGSEEWGLIALYNPQYNLKISFAATQATIQEIIAVRKLVVAYRNTPASEIKSLLKNKKEIDLGIISSIEAQQIVRQAKQLNLEIIATDVSVTNYLPIHLKTNSALIIEDNDLAKEAIEQMLKSGVSIIELTEVD